MKQLLITIAAVMLVGCGIQNDALIKATNEGNIEAVKQHLSGILSGDVNVKAYDGHTPLDSAADYPDIADLLRKHGGKTAEGK